MMSTENKDILRHEDTTTSLPSTSRNEQVTFETDLQRRMRHATSDGSANLWTPDEKFNAAIPAYANGLVPALGTVKDALDYLISATTSLVLTGSIVFPSTHVCYEAGGSGTPALPAGWVFGTNTIVSGAMVYLTAEAGFVAPWAYPMDSPNRGYIILDFNNDVGGRFLEIELGGDANFLTSVSSFSGYLYTVVLNKVL